MLTGGDQARPSPAHAGRLRPWERIAIAMLLMAMAAAIAVALL